MYLIYMVEKTGRGQYWTGHYWASRVEQARVMLAEEEAKKELAYVTELYPFAKLRRLA